MQQEYAQFQVKQQMLFSAIESHDMNTFVNVFRSLNHVQVHQLILIFNNCGETLVH